MLYQPELKSRKDLMREIINDKQELIYMPETRNISISGYVKNMSTREAVPGSRVFLSYVGSNTQIHINETKEDGFFIFPIVPYRFSQYLFLCTFDENPDQEILINNDYSTRFPSLTNIPLDIDTNDKKLLEELFINHQLLNLSQADQQINMQSKDTYIPGPGTPGISIRPEDYIDLSSMEVVLNEIVPFVKVRKRKGNYRLTVLDSETGLSYENPLILIDNIPLDDLNELMQIHPANVEHIDVINRTYMIGDHTFRGIIMVKTHTENFGGITLPMDAVFLEYPMITADRSFLQRDHKIKSENGLIQADFRNVLYWHPNFRISSDTSLSFYTSDHTSDYEIIIRGITKKGESVIGSSQFGVGEE